MKNNFKIFALIFILIISATTMCGCSQVNFVTYNNFDGSIDEYIILTIDQKVLSENGFNPLQVMLEIQTNSHDQASELLAYYHLRLSEELTLGNINNSEYTQLFGGVKITEQDWENDTYIIGFSYSNSTVYKRYYELVNNITFKPSNPEQVKKLFYTKTYYRGTTNFGDYSIFYKIYNYYTNSQFSNISQENNTLTYSYSVESRRMHSDADKVTLDKNGNYIHTWNVSPDNPNQPITFYTITANREVWIGFCLGIGLVVCSILCIIAIIKNKKTQPLTVLQDTTNNTDINEN